MYVSRIRAVGDFANKLVHKLQDFFGDFVHAFLRILLNGRFHVLTAMSLGNAQNLSSNSAPVDLIPSLASWNVQLTSPIKLGSLGAVAAEYLQAVVRFGTALLPSLLLPAPDIFVAILAIHDEQILV